MTTPNPYCEALGIAVPSVAAVRTHREANTFNLLIVTLLEHGHPMTLEAVAEHLAATGAAPNPSAARASLARCRPARGPVYRDGELYGLELHNDELDLWIFRLGLRPPRVAPPPPPPPPPAPRPTDDQRLTIAELDEAWTDRSLSGWSAQRIALAVLDAHDTPLPGDDVVAFVNARTPYHILRSASPPPFRRGVGAIHIAPDGTWSITPGAPELLSARTAVRDAVERARTQPRRSSPSQIAAATAAYERRVDATTDEDAAFRRAVVCSFPIDNPVAAVLLDITNRRLTHLTTPADLATAPTLLATYDVLAGLDIRATLRGLGLEPGTRRLAELGPPQKTVTIEGHTFKITPSLLLEGSCGIRYPLGDHTVHQRLLTKGNLVALTDRLEDDARALWALHQYAHLHGYVRLLTRRLDEIFGLPWLDGNVRRFRHLQADAARLSVGLIAVLGQPPHFDDPDPWARAVRLEVEKHGYDLVMFDELGRPIDERDVQMAKLEMTIN